MSSYERIIYTRRSDSSPETEAEVLAIVYDFILRCHEKRQTSEAMEASDDAQGGGGHDDRLTHASG
jgi:hypothetical protein